MSNAADQRTLRDAMRTARSYECPACGGLVREAARVCGYCRAPIATVRCGRCFTMNVPEAQYCTSCGVELGLQPIDIVADADAHCPRCLERRLDAFMGVDGPILDCASCGGQFVSVEVLQAMVRRYESISLAPRHRYRASNPACESVTYVRCPFCGDLMLRKNFGRVSGVVVDVCAKHGTWFDVGELPRVLSFVGDGGLQRTAALEQQLHEVERSGELIQPPRHSWSSLIDRGHTPSVDWSEMREAVRAFVGWVREQFK